MKKIISIIVLISITQLLAWSGADGEALLIPPDARSISMANTTVSIADDVNAIYWNPAGLSQIDTTQIAYSHAFWFMDFGYDFVALAYHFKNGDVLAQSIGRFGMHGIDGLDESGNPSGDTIQMSAYFINIAYSRKPFLFYLGTVRNELYVGSALKIAIEKIYTMSATIPGMDLGVLDKNLFLRGLNCGISFRNFDFSKENKLPTELDVGFSYDWTVYKYRNSEIILLPALAMNYLFDYGVSGSAGLEIQWTNPGLELENGKLRVGYILTNPDKRTTGINAGVGLSSYAISIDYAITLYNTLNYTHNLTLKYIL